MSDAAAPLLIVGGSVRAAAHSARRSGFEVEAVDRFADVDLAGVARVRLAAADGWPGSILDQVEWRPERPVVYTGPLENHLDLVEELARRGRLAGNGSAVLRAVRDPVELFRILKANGVGVAEIRLGCASVPTDGRWLRKPFGSCGGLGIRRVDGVLEEARGVYFQRRVAGRRRSAVYLGIGGGAELVGVTILWSGRAGAERFAYRGNLGPIGVPGELRAELERIGRVLVEGFGLRGLFGVDLIVDGSGRPWVIEVNPRYTAAVEVIEVATGRLLLGEHAAEFGVDAPVVGSGSGESPRAFAGKRVIYTRGRFRWPYRSAHREDRAWFGRQADLPMVGTRFEAGEPVMTLMERGVSLVGCAKRLRRRERRWIKRLAGLCAAGAERLASQSS